MDALSIFPNILYTFLPRDKPTFYKLLLLFLYIIQTISQHPHSLFQLPSLYFSLKKESSLYPISQNLLKHSLNCIKAPLKSPPIIPLMELSLFLDPLKQPPTPKKNHPENPLNFLPKHYFEKNPSSIHLTSLILHSFYYNNFLSPNHPPLNPTHPNLTNSYTPHSPP
jgi:hypothetical protein